MNRSTTSISRLDPLTERVQALEFAQSMVLYPCQDQAENLNPLNSTPSDQLTREDIAAVLNITARTLTITKCSSAPDGEVRRD